MGKVSDTGFGGQSLPKEFLREFERMVRVLTLLLDLLVGSMLIVRMGVVTLVVVVGVVLHTALLLVVGVGVTEVATRTLISMDEFPLLLFLAAAVFSLP